MEKNVSCDGYTSGENMKSETRRCVELCIILCVKLCVPYNTPMCSNSEHCSDMFLVQLSGQQQETPEGDCLCTGGRNMACRFDAWKNGAGMGRNNGLSLALYLL